MPDHVRPCEAADCDVPVMYQPAIRPATAADIDAIAELEAAGLGANAWSWVLLQAAVDSMIVLDDRSGYALVRVSGATADLDRIVVDPALQGRGHGRRLLDAVIAIASRGGAHTLLLEVAAANHAALGLYRACGFTRIARREDYYGPGADAIVMRRWLAHDQDRASLEI